MAAGNSKILTNNLVGNETQKHYFSGGTAGTLNGATEFLFTVPSGSWNITDVILAAGTNTTHTSATAITVDVLQNSDGGTSALTTPPKLIETAGTGAQNTATAGTGVTQVVIDADEDDFAGGDILFVDLAETGTGGTDPSDVSFVIELTKQQDFDPAPTG